MIGFTQQPDRDDVKIIVKYINELPLNTVLYWSSHHVGDDGWSTPWTDIYLTKTNTNSLEGLAWGWTVDGYQYPASPGHPDGYVCNPSGTDFCLGYNLAISKDDDSDRIPISGDKVDFMGIPEGREGGWTVKHLSEGLQEWTVACTGRTDIGYQWEPYVYNEMTAEELESFRNEFIHEAATEPPWGTI